MTHALFVYGTLAPGEPNAHVLADVPGTWEPASVTGHLRPDGWGAALGFPGIVLDANGPEVPGLLFRSPVLGDLWDRLDAFEGDGYDRVLTTARRPDGQVEDTYIYTLAPNQRDRCDSSAG
ncbi:gamma-glutamylcyclotransferase family protein [Cryptosporangium arvum]|uniref:gamma-glutamylcyclotransferase family protein n=1 Tax=Cryptosporangium arvum TaxID=80871 RepID=UPI00056640FC|nr:gamma-glutamylcyclotransferase family protein [Cryptosporangium arvum]